MGCVFHCVHYEILGSLTPTPTTHADSFVLSHAHQVFRLFADFQPITAFALTVHCYFDVALALPSGSTRHRKSLKYLTCVIGEDLLVYLASYFFVESLCPFPERKIKPTNTRKLNCTGPDD